MFIAFSAADGVNVIDEGTVAAVDYMRIDANDGA